MERSEQQDSEAKGYADRLLRTDGMTLYARDYPGADGEAKLPLICLHGLTRNSKDFHNLASHVSGLGRRVIVPDMRGRGRSDHDPEPMNYVPKTYARDVLSWMRALGLERAAFLGTSMGGIIMMALAMIESRRLASAILNDVGPEIAPEGLQRISAYVGKAPSISTWDDARAYVRGTSAIAFPNWTEADWDRFARQTFRTDAQGRPAFDYDPEIAAPIRAGKVKAPRMLAWFLFRRLARRRPTLLIRGARSDILSSAIADRMRRSAPAMMMVEIENVGHAPTLDEAEAVAAIDRFLDDQP
jgi:pimeloyl-ACP methyl ester carboxylesterase